MRDKAPGKRFVYSVRQARPGEAILPNAHSMGPQAQADGDPFRTVEAGTTREAAADRAYSVDVNGTRYYFHRDLKRAVIVTRI